jgi:glycosyltransferase involved in cell wall biosynthesis
LPGLALKVAIVTNLPTHYRRPLFERLARVHDATFFFTYAGKNRYWSNDHDLAAGAVRARPTPSGSRLFAGLVRGGYDCIVASLTGRFQLLLTVAAARLSRTPLVLWVGIWEHPRTLPHRLSRRVVAALYRHADAVAVYGSHVAQHVERESGRTNGVFEIPQAVDNQLFRDATLVDAVAVARDDAVTACFVGRLEPEKGLDVLLNALQWIPDVALVIAGSGSERPLLERLAGDLGISERVRFVGYMPQGRLPSLFEQVDFLVLPSVTTSSFKEPWGLVANEAMNAGLPVVATDAVGAVAGGLVIDEQTGLVVPERDVERLAGALSRMVGDASLRSRLGAAAREHVLRWNYDAAMAGLDAAIRAAVEAQA